MSRQTSSGPAVPGASYVNRSPIPIPAPEPVPVRVGSPVPLVPVSDGDIHIVSNARGPFPQLEMFEVSRRGHTISIGHRHTHSEARTRALHRITKKLTDVSNSTRPTRVHIESFLLQMGFTEGSHHQKVMDQLIANPPTSKDAEDDIVTNVIEELITGTSNLPRAGPSRDDGIPGAWH